MYTVRRGGYYKLTELSKQVLGGVVERLLIT